MNKEFPVIFYTLLRQFRNIIAFTTTKNGWDLPNARFTGDSPELYRPNREKLAQSLGIDAGQLVFPRQEHTSRVVILTRNPETEIRGADALVTATPGLCLCVQTADCVPILLYDPVEKAIAAVHAGWRGTAGKIVAEAVSKMVAGFGSLPGNIYAIIGPSIGPEVYEVGAEVVETFIKSMPSPEKIFRPLPGGKALLNLWEANRLILQQSGIAAKNIEIAGLCTFSNNQQFFSARRDGSSTGRMVSGILIKAGPASF